MTSVELDELIEQELVANLAASSSMIDPSDTALCSILLLSTGAEIFFLAFRRLGGAGVGLPPMTPLGSLRSRHGLTSLACLNVVPPTSKLSCSGVKVLIGGRIA